MVAKLLKWAVKIKHDPPFAIMRVIPFDTRDERTLCVCSVVGTRAESARL